jgi:acyl dehydratase
MAVYLLSDGDYLKIGYTSRDVARRVRELQTGSPRDIRLVAALLDAGPEIERELHARFAAYRIRSNGEWFHDTQDIHAEFSRRLTENRRVTHLQLAVAALEAAGLAEKAQRLAETKQRALVRAGALGTAAGLVAWPLLYVFINSGLWSFVLAVVVGVFGYAYKAGTINDEVRSVDRLFQEAQEATDALDRYAPVRVGDTVRMEAVKARHSGIAGRVIEVQRLHVRMDDGTNIYRVLRAAVTKVG